MNFFEERMDDDYTIGPTTSNNIISRLDSSSNIEDIKTPNIQTANVQVTDTLNSIEANNGSSFNDSSNTNPFEMPDFNKSTAVPNENIETLETLEAFKPVENITSVEIPVAPTVSNIHSEKLDDTIVIPSNNQTPTVSSPVKEPMGQAVVETTIEANKEQEPLANKEDFKSFGSIIAANENIITVKLNENILTLPNLIDMHVVFIHENDKVVGEVIYGEVDHVKVNIIGQIKDNVFITGLTRKPDFNSKIRVITNDEVALIFGNQKINSAKQIHLGYSTIYKDYKINIDINDFFSNHFAIIGNTGSGKSCTLARLVQNVFTSGNYLPLNVNIFLFDAYGEYNTAFSSLSKINPILNYKTYTTNTIYPDTEILKIPLWLLDVDDIALLLGASESAQLPIIEKALKLVPILKGTGEKVEAYKNDIISRALLDILKSGREAPKIRDQITAVLTTFYTDRLHLDSVIKQMGYDRTIRQCIYVDNNGKLQEMELLVAYLSTFVIADFVLPSPTGDVAYTLNDLQNAMDFALISEGILKSDKVFDYANILSIRLHALAGSEAAKYFEYDKLVTRNGYISELLTTYDNKKAQIINFNINYVDDRMAKNITKIISKMLFSFAAEYKDRGTIPFHIVIEEAHRYVQNDTDISLLGYNIFERITKEGRKYGVILGLITQRPSELTETCISQCSNFIILRMQHPKDLNYIKQMVPNFSEELSSMLRILQPGNAIAFGNAFKIPVAIRLDKPDPEPYSRNSDIAKIWYAEK